MRERLTFTLGVLVAMTVHAAEPAGYVLEVQGHWLQKGELAPLTVGAPISAGALITAPAPAPGDRLTVVAARTGSILVARRCDDPAACRRPVIVPVPPAAPTSGFLQRVFAAFADRPDRYVTTLNRAASLPNDAVLIWDAGRLDLGPILAGRPEGMYDIALTPLGCPTGASCPDAAAVEARLVWSPRAPAATVELAQPGLFELSLRRSEQATTLPPERSWVLAVRQADAAAARERVRDATALAESWGDDVDALVKRGFIRAAMSLQDR